MSRIRREGGRCFACGAAGARPREVGDTAVTFLFCPRCEAEKGALAPGSAQSRSGERRNAAAPRSVWSAPPAKYPVCPTREEFVALATRLLGAERAEIALSPPAEWEAAPGGCREPGCTEPVYKFRRYCLVHYWQRHRERASA